MSDVRSPAHVFLLIGMAVWAGALVGVSFIATPAKFQAPSLTMSTGLEIGRYTFRLFARLELFFLIALVVAAVIARPRRFTAAALVIVAIQVSLQRYWLLPLLVHRVSQILAGGSVEFSRSHWVYAAFEATKTALLIAAASVEYP